MAQSFEQSQLSRLIQNAPAQIKLKDGFGRETSWLNISSADLKHIMEMILGEPLTEAFRPKG